MIKYEQTQRVHLARVIRSGSHKHLLLYNVTGAER